MTDKFVETFVEKLILLEQKTGANVQYRTMPPTSVLFQDYLSIQKIAKDIADFVGLNDYVFIVAVAKQMEKVGGHIDLSTQGNNVFIEIDEDMMKFPEVVAATLCHEVCHKWLQLNGILAPIEADNEILTDITSTFLGFGKIMLNGCKTTKVKYKTFTDVTHTFTETMTSGYLDRNQLAFVYRLVCAMRNIPSSDFMQGLNPEAIQAVQFCDLLVGRNYDSRFHRIETIKETVQNFQDHLVLFQQGMAKLDKHVVYVKKSFCDTVDTFLKTTHRQVQTLWRKSEAMTQDIELDPALRFLKNIQNEIEIQRMKEEIRAAEQESDEFLKHAKMIGCHFVKNGDRFPAPSPDMFKIVTCPQDGTKLRLPAMSGMIIATCPACDYRFAYDTSPVSFSEPSAPRRPSLIERFRNLLKRKR